MYDGATLREALAGLVCSVCTRPGLTVLVGEAGTGKTTLLFALAELLEKRRFVTAVCNNPTLKREEFFDLLLSKLGIDCESPLKSRQLAALQAGLLKYQAEGRPAILIVDEGPKAVAPSFLQEIRLLLNLETPREKLLEIIMAGQPELSEILQGRPRVATTQTARELCVQIETVEPGRSQRIPVSSFDPSRIAGTEPVRGPGTRFDLQVYAGNSAPHEHPLR